MQNPIDSSNPVPSEKKSTPLKFAWDKFKDIGAIPSTVGGKPAASQFPSPVADPMHARHREYQELLTKRGQGAVSLRQIPKVAIPQKPECSGLGGRWLIQGLHESSIHQTQDLGRFAAHSVAFLLGA